MTQYAGYVLICLGLSAALSARAQSVQNVRANFDGERVEIRYDLNAADPGGKFKVALYSSHDNYAHPLTLLTGDVGDEVAPGRDRKVLWFAKNVLPPDFDQEITFKIRVTLAEAVRLSLKPLVKTVVKRGTSLQLEWVGGTATDQVNIELLKDGQVQTMIAEKIVNVRQYRWSLPRKLKTGEGYAIRVSNPNRNSEITTTQTFNIKPRLPLLVKLLPLAIGAAVYLMIPDPPPPPPPGLEDLPGPIDPD